MVSSTTLLSLVLLVASSSVGVLSTMARTDNGGFKHLHMYMHEFTGGENATVLQAVTNSLRANTKFGMVNLLDNELRDGPIRSNSTLIGRFQGIVVYLGLVNPGTDTVISFVFTDGELSGSTLVLIGLLITNDGAYERAIVGGTGKFRMARGYSLVTVVSRPTPIYTVYEVNLFLKMDV